MLGWKPEWALIMAQDQTTKLYEKLKRGNNMDKFSLELVNFYEQNI